MILGMEAEDTMPVAWKITHILHARNRWVLLLQRVICAYEPHFKSYIVTGRTQEIICTQPISPIHPPLECFILAGYEAFSLRHAI